MVDIRQIWVTYLQYDSPLGFETQWPPFLQGDGAHDINPRIRKKNQNLLSFGQNRQKKIFVTEIQCSCKSSGNCTDQLWPQNIEKMQYLFDAI